MTRQISYMAKALELAKRGLFSTDPNPRVGAVLVKDNQVIAEGFHVQAGQPHAEIHALNIAGQNAAGATCYVTLEPCAHHGLTAPCADALIKAKVKKVVVAMQDPNPKVSGKGIARLRAAGIEVDVGLMQAEALTLNRGFVKRMTAFMPLTIMKLAMSVDGRTAMESGESQWISSEESRRDVQRLRARVSAIITGSDTVLIDNPRMTVRPADLGYRAIAENDFCRQPLRVVIDGQQRLHPDLQFFKGEGRSMIVLDQQSDKVNLFKQAGVEVMQVDRLQDHLNLTSILSQLATQYQANEVMIEAGAKLCGAFLRAELVDELELYVAAKIMGDNARGLFHMPDMYSMAQVKNLAFKSVRFIGNDLRISCRPMAKTELH